MDNEMLLFSVVIKINKENFLKINQLFSYKVKIITQNHDFFYLQLLEKDLPLLDEAKIIYQIYAYKGLKHLFRHIKTHLSIIIGIILFVLIIYGNTLTIKEISFSTYTKDNEKISAIINEHLTSYHNIKYLNTDINEINLLLRKEFSNYEWISVKKTGCNLYVTILEPSIINKEEQLVEGSGDLVATKDGMIKFFQVKQGIPLIELNQFVKQGQILVSGNLRYNNADESEFYIPADGKVYAEVWYTKTIEVKKELMATEYTGKIKVEKSFSLFGLDIKYKTITKNYQNYDTEVTYSPLKIFSIKLPIGIKKIHYLEKNDIMYMYDANTALEFATSQIRYQMIKTFTEGDKILDIELLTQSEDNEKFTFNIFVKTYENIAIFQRRTLNE